MKGGRTRRKVDILGMLVSIIGSKDQLVNEYRVMLAEKLLNKSDYDIDSEIRTLELLKVLPWKRQLTHLEIKKYGFFIFIYLFFLCSNCLSYYLLIIFQIHFGENSMQKCEIMLNDLIDSKRTNSNIKATINLPSQKGMLINIMWLFCYASDLLILGML